MYVNKEQSQQFWRKETMFCGSSLNVSSPGPVVTLEPCLRRLPSCPHSTRPPPWPPWPGRGPRSPAPGGPTQFRAWSTACLSPPTSEEPVFGFEIWSWFCDIVYSSTGQRKYLGNLVLTIHIIIQSNTLYWTHHGGSLNLNLKTLIRTCSYFGDSIMWKLYRDFIYLLEKSNLTRNTFLKKKEVSPGHLKLLSCRR